MTYRSTSTTTWPTAATQLPSATKDLLGKYFDLLDTNSPTASQQTAELFASDGYTLGPGGRKATPDQLASLHPHRWSGILARSHTLERVYTFDPEGTDLVVLGKASQTLDVAGGKEKTLEGEWAARIIVVVGQKDGDVKIKMHQVWADFGGLAKAVEEARSAA